MFLADNRTFTLDMISGLEEYAIVMAHESNRYKVENAIKPKYVIDEYDLPFIEEVYEEIKFIMATRGYKMDNAETTAIESEVFYTSKNCIVAKGVYIGEQFTVLSGSEVDISRKCTLDSLNEQRKTAIENGDLCVTNGKYFLTKSVSFKTPSGAACFVLGLSKNGSIEWKNKDGKTLDEIFKK